MKLDRGKSAPPLYIQVTDILRKRILAGYWGEGEALPPEHQLCQEFDVSRGTLRQALDQLAQDGLLSREQGRGTFVTLLNVRREPADLPATQVAFIVPYVRDTFVSTILLGIERGAAERGYSVVFDHVSNSLIEQTNALNKCAEQELAGVILYPVDSAHPEPVSTLVARGYPIVLVDRYLYNVDTDYVMSDHFGGGLKAMQHLISLGHRRIAFVSWKEAAIGMMHRHCAYRQALLESDIPYDAALTCQVEGYPRIDTDELRNLLTMKPPVTAIFAANDQVALAVNQAARQFGRHVPGDLALVGFDNLDVVHHLDTPLTTVAQFPAELGRTAVELLVRRIRGEASTVQRAILPTQLIVRRSCGSSPGQPSEDV